MHRSFAAGHLPAMTAGILLSFSPNTVLAGGLGSAGTADAEVGNGRATAGIYCPALDATVPQSLASQIDCDEEGVAQPAVADDRIENRGFRFPFLPASGPIRDFDDTEDNEDNNGPQLSQDDPAPQAAPPDPQPDPEPDPEEDQDPPPMTGGGGD